MTCLARLVFHVQISLLQLQLPALPSSHRLPIDLCKTGHKSVSCGWLTCATLSGGTFAKGHVGERENVVLQRENAVC